MQLSSKTSSLLILGITALILSRSMFALFDDPEGPNLLIVVVMGVILYVPSVLMYLFGLPKSETVQKLLIAILVQVLFAGIFYFAGR